MTWLLPFALGCVSLLHLQLSLGHGGGPRPAWPRKLPARNPSSDLRPRQPASRPVVWKLPRALQTQRTASLAQPLQDSHHRHLGLRQQAGGGRPQQPLRLGCVLGTCRVQHLSYRLWQLVGPAGRRASAPVDPSSPYSYG